jgi:hypothetical protein
VLKLPNTLLADAQMVGRFNVGKRERRLSDFILNDIATWWAPAHYAVAGGVHFTRGMGAAALRVGFGARWAFEPTVEGRAYVADQFRLMAAGDVKQMSNAVAALWKRVQHEKFGQGVLDQRDRYAAITYYYASPVRAPVAPLVRDPDEIKDELSRVLSRMESAFLAAPKGAAHPYLFDRADQQLVQPRRVRVRVRDTKGDIAFAADHSGP